MTDQARCVPYDDTMAVAWDAFVFRHPDATFYHQIAWRDVISRVYGLRPHYFACVKEGEIVGVAPLFEMRDLSWQRALVSLPFSNYGGILADSTTVGAMLVQEIRRHKASCGASYAVLKRQHAAHDDGTDIVFSQVYCSPCIELADCEESMFRRLPGKTRNQVRKANKCGASVRADSENVRQDFLDLYYDNMRRFGTPCHRHVWFRDVSETFGERCLYVAVNVDGHTVAAAMTLIFRRCAILQHAVSCADARSTCGNVFLYWSVIAEAIRRGMTSVDCGRSRVGSGSERFKKQWCANSVETPYMYVTGAEVPDEHPSNPKFKRVISCWQMMPLRMTKIIGPLLRKHITT